MKSQYSNGMIVYNQKDLRMRQFLFREIAQAMQEEVRKINKFDFHEIESPCLIPTELINKEYQKDQFFYIDEEVSLKPETTPASYNYAQEIMGLGESRPPLCVYQMSKSFRREDDKTFRHCRFKEFYQLEFQFIYSESTADDYYAKIQDVALGILTKLFPERKIQKIQSDRLPVYSKSTNDIEMWDEDRWMEVCSMSLRNDFPDTYIQGWGTKKMLVTEIAIGMDRLLYLKS